MASYSRHQEGNLNTPEFELMKNLFIDLTTDIKLELLAGNGPGILKIFAITPGLVIDYSIALQYDSTTSIWKANLLASTDVVSGTALWGVVSTLIGGSLALTAGLPATVAVGVGTALWMYANNDLVSNFSDVMKAIAERLYDGQPNDEWRDFVEDILDKLDGWFGTPTTPPAQATLSPSLIPFSPAPSC